MRKRSVTGCYNPGAMTETFTIVQLEELKRMVVTCPAKDCGTAIEFDATEKRPPSKCPSCGAEFGAIHENLHAAIAHFRKFYQEMTSFGLKPRFRIRVDYGGRFFANDATTRAWDPPK
jgi:IBR domain, a half RING-finger domain